MRESKVPDFDSVTRPGGSVQGIDLACAPPRTAELVVVGGGVIGAATAFHAARAGFKPVILEARPALCTLTTPVAAGAFRLQFDNREEFELVRESVELFLSFAEATSQRCYDLRLRQQGYLWLTKTADGAGRQRELVARQHSWGLTDVELLPGDVARARFPFVAGDVLQARFRAGDGFLDTRALTLGLAAGSRAPVVPNCRVLGFDLRGDRLVGVRTTNGSIECDRAVIAAGPLSGPLARSAGVQLPVVAVRRHKLVMPEVPEVPSGAPMVIDEETGTHWRPALAGAWLLFTDPSTAPSAPTEDVPVDQRFAFQILEPDSPVAAARTAPFWRDVWERGAAHWLLQAGQYTVTPDHRPLIGHTAIEGLFVNTGYSGHGIMAGTAGSRILGDLLAGRLSAEGNGFRMDRAFAPGSAPLL
jgi:sarcosine oxidase subunit beta